LAATRQGRLTASSKASTEGIWLQQWEDGRIPSRNAQNGEVFDKFEVRYVPRLDNCDVDHLAWIASSRAPTTSDVIVERLSKPSVKPTEPSKEVVRQDLMVIDEPEQDPVYDWMQPIKMFLKNQPPLHDNVEVERNAHKSKQYHLVDGILFWRYINGMMMNCISIEEFT
jgi:hypothetical protein